MASNSTPVTHPYIKAQLLNDLFKSVFTLDPEYHQTFNTWL